MGIGVRGEGQKHKNQNFADFSKELGLRSVKNGRSISKRAPGPDYRPDSLILRSESDISIFYIRFRSLFKGTGPQECQKRILQEKCCPNPGSKSKSVPWGVVSRSFSVLDVFFRCRAKLSKTYFSGL